MKDRPTASRIITIGCSFEQEFHYCSGDCPARSNCLTAARYRAKAHAAALASVRTRNYLDTLVWQTHLALTLQTAIREGNAVVINEATEELKKFRRALDILEG